MPSLGNIDIPQAHNMTFSEMRVTLYAHVLTFSEGKGDIVCPRCDIHHSSCHTQVRTPFTNSAFLWKLMDEHTFTHVTQDYKVVNLSYLMCKGLNIYNLDLYKVFINHYFRSTSIKCCLLSIYGMNTLYTVIMRLHHYLSLL
jgi:hypothetical protein